MKLQKRLLLLGLSTFVIGGFVVSQMYIHQKNKKELKDIARELARNWKEKLDLTEEQAVYLEKIIIDFTIRKNEIINSDAPQKTIITRLQKIQRREHRNLKKILNEPQFEAYVGINKIIPNSIMDSVSVG